MSDTFKLDTDTIELLKSEHGQELFATTLESENLGYHVEFVFIRPPKGEYNRVLKLLQDEDKRRVALENLFNACVVWPEKADRDALLDKYPGFSVAAAEGLLESVGVVKAETKKL